jgi:4-diphosphocytidyl-2-C-methyl-D-erythritol kinase
MTLTRFAPAKINLFLHVARPRANGLHPIDSVAIFASDVGDWVSAGPASDLTLEISGPFASALLDEPDNLMLRAARALAQAADMAPCAALQLDKALPVASGIGGGSSDAAATLLALNELWGLRAPLEDLAPIAASLGADVPACLHARAVRMSGAGEVTVPLDVPILPAVLVNAGHGVATASVYQAFDAMGLGSDGPPAHLPADASGFVTALAGLRNDLEAPAISVVPSVPEVLACLRQHAPGRVVRMSGSGATCFALCQDDDEAEALAARVRAEHPLWWVRACQLA